MKKYFKLFALLLVATMGFSACSSKPAQVKKQEDTKEKTDKVNYQISFSGSSTLAPVHSLLIPTVLIPASSSATIHLM